MGLQPKVHHVRAAWQEVAYPAEASYSPAVAVGDASQTSAVLQQDQANAQQVSVHPEDAQYELCAAAEPFALELASDVTAAGDAPVTVSAFAAAHARLCNAAGDQTQSVHVCLTFGTEWVKPHQSDALVHQAAQLQSAVKWRSNVTADYAVHLQGQSRAA